MACAAYKLLLGPYGTGFAYVARELLAKLDLPVINWYSVEGAEDFDSLPTEEFRLIHDARVFDSGETGNFINLHGLEASLEFVEGVTVRTVNAHCRRLLQSLGRRIVRPGLHSLGGVVARPRIDDSGLPCLRLSAATAELHQKLSANHIAVSLRHGMIRVSPYLYNDEADIDRLLALA